MSEKTMAFQAEVNQLLNIVTDALYSDTEIFLRELISNAADACDKLRYLSATHQIALETTPDFRLILTIDKNTKTLTLTDNGIGMSEQELIDNLGTIAKSGTNQFIQALKGDKTAPTQQIGKFGVGFYSSFMVAQQVEVISRKAGQEKGYVWASHGKKGDFNVKEYPEKTPVGTTIRLLLKESAQEFLEKERLKHIIKKYCDHIMFPIELIEGEEREQVNKASALWKRSKSDITKEEYKEFYHHCAHLGGSPRLTIHFTMEGTVTYTGLLFIPTEKPFDLFDAERKNRLKLYIQRVFITDDCHTLLPPYLRFVKGIIESEDLPLNVSREMLQNNPVIHKIRAGLTKKILSELDTFSHTHPEEYLSFWQDFGAVLKEGLCDDLAHRESLLKLARFYSLKLEEYISLEDYVKEMPKEQTSIYYFLGSHIESMKDSPQLEGFRERGADVLFLTDPIDEFWVPFLGPYQEKNLTPITSADLNLEAIPGEQEQGERRVQDQTKNTDSKIATLLAYIKTILAEEVTDVKESHRLVTSPVCLVHTQDEMGFFMERLLNQSNSNSKTQRYVLEVNPRHLLIQAMAKKLEEASAREALNDLAWLLYNQALIQEGKAIPNMKHLNEILSKINLKYLSS